MTTGYVYFAQAFSGGPIKIGHSRNPEQRIRTFNTASPEPLDLITTLPGGRRIEGLLHDTFKHGRLHGEWFAEDTVGLAEVIEALVAPDLTNPFHRDIHDLAAKMRAEA